MTIVEQGKPALDALECLDALALEMDEHALGVLICAAPDLVGVVLAGRDDLLRSDLGGTSQFTLFDQKRGLLLRAGEDALCLLVGALGDPVAFFVDALGLTDLLRYGDTQLVDQVEGTGL